MTWRWVALFQSPHAMLLACPVAEPTLLCDKCSPRCAVSKARCAPYICRTVPTAAASPQQQHLSVSGMCNACILCICSYLPTAISLTRW